MVSAARRKKPSHNQAKYFVETARALECDESERTFDKALGNIGRATAPEKAKKKSA